MNCSLKSSCDRENIFFFCKLLQANKVKKKFFSHFLDKCFNLLCVFFKPTWAAFIYVQTDLESKKPSRVVTCDYHRIAQAGIK